MNADSQLWAVRAYIYRQSAETARPPTPAETAREFGWTTAQAEAIYRDLHNRHAIFLEPGQAVQVRMDNPFSAIPTAFRVRAGGQSYYANCAWDAFGIPAALGTDATIEAECAQAGQPLRFAVRAEAMVISGDPALVHFPLPFARWYDDLIET